MQLLDGFTLIEQTDDKIVQEMRFGETGVIRMIGNPNPPPAERQAVINEVARILYKGYLRDMENKGA